VWGQFQGSRVQGQERDVVGSRWALLDHKIFKRCESHWQLAYGHHAGLAGLAIRPARRRDYGAIPQWRDRQGRLGTGYPPISRQYPTIENFVRVAIHLRPASGVPGPGARSHGQAHEVAPRKWTKAVSFQERLMKQLKSQKRHSPGVPEGSRGTCLMTGRTLSELAEELAVPVATLHRWKEDYLLELKHQPTDVTALPPLQDAGGAPTAAQGEPKAQNCIRRS